MTTVIDHLVVVAPDLASGAGLVEQALGVEPAPGGPHEQMGTHNLVLRTGDSTYLEVIAVDPDADPPGHARWFALDGPVPEPTLALWVARSGDVVSTAARAREPLGPVEALSRGEISWRLTLPTDGSVPLDGLGPLVLQWDGASAATRLPESPIRLVSLTIAHPDAERVRAQLLSLGLAGPVTVQQDLVPHLIASFDTPSGPRVLTGLGGDSLSIERERQIAMDLFNLTWAYLDMDARTAEQDTAMAQCAEASRWHWQHVGTPTQFAIGDWQCSRVHAVLGDGDRALSYARRCLEIAQADRVEDFVPASAHEAMARAYAVLGDMDAAREQRNLAYRIAVDLDNEDRDVIEHDLGTLPIT
ncbi:MAG: tetratricopeptide repeat protein [Actinomycetales bacterium]|nr:tetratricopeptide repeat protein [Actinomycetales bacterium]